SPCYHAAPFCTLYFFISSRARRDLPSFPTRRSSDLPLWAGVATPRRAARVVSNMRLFERAGGLQTSTSVSGNQWDAPYGWAPMRSEEHTSELQSLAYLVCRLLLEKKKYTLH